MTRLVRAELLKLRTTQVWFWLLLTTVAVAGLLVVAQLAPSDGIQSASDVPDMFASSATAYIVVYVLGVLGVTTEFRHQTITPTMLQTPSRWSVVTAKLISFALVGLSYAIVAVVVQLVIAVPWLSAKSIDVDYGGGRVLHAILGVLAVMALFGIIGLGIGALVKNQVVAVVVGIIFLLVIDNIVLAIPYVKYAYPYLPNGGINAIVTSAQSDRVMNGVTIFPTWGGVVVLLLWALVPALVGASFTLNRDIT